MIRYVLVVLAICISSRAFPQVDQITYNGCSPLKEAWASFIQTLPPPSADELRAQQQADSLEFIGKPTVFLSLSSSKASMHVGECAVLELTLYINYKNRQPLQFYELGQQLSALLTGDLRKDACWQASGLITNIEGVQKTVGGSTYTGYTIYRGAVCPMKATPIYIKPLKLELMLPNPDSAVVKTVSFTSKSITIQVNQLPAEAQPTVSKLYPMVGQFTLFDTVMATNASVHEPITYTVTMLGEGLTFPWNPTIKQHNAIDMRVQRIVDFDTIINRKYYSCKEITYLLTCKQPGTYLISDLLSATAFNPVTGKVKLLKPRARIQVSSLIQKNLLGL